MCIKAVLILSISIISRNWFIVDIKFLSFILFSILSTIYGIIFSSKFSVIVWKDWTKSWEKNLLIYFSTSFSFVKGPLWLGQKREFCKVFGSPQSHVPFVEEWKFMSWFKCLSFILDQHWWHKIAFEFFSQSTHFHPPIFIIFLAQTLPASWFNFFSVRTKSSLLVHENNCKYLLLICFKKV